MSGLLFLVAKRKSGWGICGSSGCFVLFLVCSDLPALSDLLGPCIVMFYCLCSCKDRARARHRPYSRKKKVQQSDVAPAARLSGLAARLWPDACQDEDSDIAQVMRVGQEPHTGTWAATGQVHHLPSALGRLLDLRTLSHLNITSSLVATALSVIFFPSNAT